MTDVENLLVVRLERDGARYEIGVPFERDIFGNPMIAAVQAAGAAELLRSAAYPETIVALPFPPLRRRNKKHRLTESGGKEQTNSRDANA
jgi:hypothetical protein